MHVEAARDPILSTQRIREVKISMVGIDKVKVRFPNFVLAHVSHFFFQNESRRPSSNRRIFQFSNVLQFYACQTCPCLWPPCQSLYRFSTHFEYFICFAFRSSPCFGPRVALFSRTRAVGAQAIDACFSFRTC